MKKALKSKKTNSLALRKETLRRLGDLDLQGVAGAGRYWKPLGVSEDTTSIYSYVDEP